MIKGKGIKLGDTLVEVTLAIGIFSMVAIAAVSVISASTSGTQSILENTLTREQIDSQAEALRFIQSAYAAEGERDPSNPTKYALLWQAISSHAISLEGTDAVSSDVKNNILNYNPTTCSALYTDTTASIVSQDAFIINLNALGSDVDKNNVGNIVVSAKDNTVLNGTFRPATTYPRLIYGAADNLDDPLYNPNVSSNLYAAEGLFVVAVKDTSGTTIVSDDTGNIGSISAYIDFYIRSCWFATGSERPTTISTVIRLYNPDTVFINKYERKGVIIKYAKGADDVTGTMPSQYILSGTSASPLANRYERPGYKFMGWALQDASGNTVTEYLLKDDDTYSTPYTAPTNLSENQTVTLTAIWKYEYTLTLTYYDTDGSTVLCSENKTSTSSSYDFIIKGCSTQPVNPDPTGEEVLQGWSEDKEEGREPLYNVNGADGTLGKITASASGNHQNIKLYPVWRKVITFQGDLWNKTVANAYSDCQVFNINPPSEECLKKGCSLKQKISKGDIWAGYNAAPYNGYIINKGENIELYEDGINLQGNCYGSANVGVYYEIGTDDTFELQAALNTVGIRSHPEGYVDINIGPLNTRINDTSITSSCGSSRKSTSFANGSLVIIKMTKYNNDYSMSINGNILSQCTLNYSATNGKIMVKYNMYHGSHYCNKLFNVQLTDIKMKQVIKE